MIKLLPWQEEALQSWKNNDYKGIIEACTGSGKSFIGLQAISELNNGESCIIIVPTIHLMQEWYDKIKLLDNKQYSAGRLGGGFNDLDSYKDIMIAVIDSIRERSLKTNLLILDEIHHYASEENINIFDKISMIKLLGLTATLERNDKRHLYITSVYPVIYQYELHSAVKDEVINDYKLLTVPVELNKKEQEELNGAEKFINDNFYKYFEGKFDVVIKHSKSKSEFTPLAFRLLHAFSKRRKILLECKSRIHKTGEISFQNKGIKQIIFCEYISTAKKIQSKLKEFSVTSEIYHSKISDYHRDRIIKEFRNSRLMCLVAVRALDEGMDIPDVDMAVIAAGSSVKRQQVQRIGRILRKGYTVQSKIYELYVPGSQEEKWLERRNQSSITN